MTARKRVCVVCAERPALGLETPECGVCSDLRLRSKETNGIAWAARRARAFEAKRAKARIDDANSKCVQSAAAHGDVIAERDEWLRRAVAVEAKFEAARKSTLRHAEEAFEWKARALAAEAKLAEKDRS